MKIYLLLLLSLICFQGNSQEVSVFKASTATELNAEIDYVIERLTDLVSINEAHKIINFHGERAGSIKINCRDSYKEIEKTIHFSDFKGESRIMEKIRLKLYLENYLRELVAFKPEHLTFQDINRVGDVILLLRRVSNKVVDGDTFTNTLIRYTVIYDNPLNLSVFLKEGVDKGFWDKDILNLLKS